MKKYVTFYYTLLSTSKTQGDNVSSCVICSQWNAHDSNLHQRFNFIIIVSLFMFTAGLRLLPQAFHRSSLVKPKSFFPPEFFYSMPPLSWMSSPTSSHCYPDAPPDSVLHARPKPTFFFLNLSYDVFHPRLFRDPRCSFPIPKRYFQQLSFHDLLSWSKFPFKVFTKSFICPKRHQQQCASISIHTEIAVPFTEPGASYWWKQN